MATPVEIVRPEKGLRESLVDFFYSVAVLALRAWLVMLLLPVVWKPVGYWWSLALVAVVGILTTSADDHRLWTRSDR